MIRNIAVVLSGRDAGLARTLGAASGALTAFDRQVTGLGTRGSAAMAGLKFALLGIATAAAIGLGAAIVSAVSFEREMRNVNTVMHASEPEFRAMSDAVLEMSTRLPQSAATLAKGLYDIGSSGFYGAEALQILEVSATAASAGLTDTATASRAIVGVLNSYGLEAAAAADVSDVLFKTVELGVITFEELANNLGEVTAGAASAGIGIDEVGSALATMTLSGLNASESTTSLNRLIRAIIDPSEALARVLKAAGFESGAMALQQEGLYGVMQLVNDATGGSVTALQTLFPEIRASRGAYALLANEGQTYARVQSQITDEQRRAGATQEAFNEQMKAVSNQWRLFVNNLQAAGIKLGTMLLPALTRGLELMREWGRDLGDLGRRAAPAFDAIADAGRAVWRVIVQLARAAKPLVTALAGIASAAIIGGITAIARALEAVANFLADHQGLVMAVAAAYGVSLTARLLAAAAAFVKVQAGLLAVRAGLIGLAAASPVNTIGALVGGLLALREVLGTIDDEVKKADLSDLENQLLDLAETGEVSGAVLKRTFDGLGMDPESARQTKSDLDAIDEALAKLAARDPAAAARSFRIIEDALLEMGASKEQIRDVFDTYQAAVDNARDASESATPAVAGLASSFEAAAADTELATSALEEYVEQLAATYDPIFGFVDALQENRDAQTELRDATAALNEARAAGDVEAIAEAEERYAQAVTGARDSVVGLQSAAATLQDAIENQGLSVYAARNSFIAMAEAQGFTRQEAALLADQFGLTAGAADLLEASDPQVEITEVGADRVMGQLTAAQMDAINLGRQRPVVRASANTNEALQRIRQAKDRAVDLGAQRPTPVISARDNASNIIRDVQRLLGGLHDKTFTVTTHFVQIGAPGPQIQRLGGVVPAQLGLLQAAVYHQPSVLFGERATGGEAFIPRYGNANRSKSILAEAAGWYGMQLVPQGGASRGGGDVNINTVVEVQVTAPGGIMAFGAKYRTVEDAIAAGVNVGLVDHDRKLLRALKSQ